MNTPIFEENAIDDFKGIDIMRAVRSFDPCLPCGVHMYLGNGKVLRKEHSPTMLAQRRRLIHRPEGGAWIHPSTSESSATASRSCSAQLESTLDGRALGAGPGRRRPRHRALRRRAGAHPRARAGEDVDAPRAAGRRRPGRVAARPARAPPARPRRPGAARPRLGAAVPRLPRRRRRGARRSTGTRASSPADARQLRRLRVVVGHPRAGRAGGHRGSRARDHPHRRRRGRRRAHRAPARPPPRSRSAASRSTRARHGADLRAAGPGAGPRRAARDRGQQADRVPGRHAALRLPQRVPARARAPSTRPRSTVRCCAARCAARPTTCRVPAGASTATPTHLDPLPLVEDGGEVRIAVTAAHDDAIRSTSCSGSARRPPRPAAGRALRHVRRAGARRARARRQRRDPQPDVHVPRLLAAVHEQTAPAAASTAPCPTATSRSATCTIAPGDWDELQIPVSVAFFFRNSSHRLRRRVLPEPRRGHRVAAARSTRGTAWSPTTRCSARWSPTSRRSSCDGTTTTTTPTSCRSTPATSWSARCAGCGRASTAAPRRSDAMDAFFAACAERCRVTDARDRGAVERSPSPTRRCRRCCCRLGLDDAEAEPVHAIVLKAQIRIEPQRRRYSPRRRRGCSSCSASPRSGARRCGRSCGPTSRPSRRVHRPHRGRPAGAVHLRLRGGGGQVPALARRRRDPARRCCSAAPSSLPRRRVCRAAGAVARRGRAPAARVRCGAT